MNRRRLAFAWIACFAVLFNMLAMPLSGAMAQAGGDPAGQILWSSFCTGSGMKMVAIDIGATDKKAPQNDSHSNMQHCWCCSGSAPLLALPGHSPQLYFARFESNRSVAPVALQAPAPRQQWPSLNPRASPLV
ncbi:DUF2946 domain-containing protein [Pseudomonas sp. NDM]|uniref:DUF2946 domain-containing protein n=1 Tax=Pseudomonas sp. NDM TaxID=2170733 RepID=UPI000D5CA01F|nr:DUF2946 domain-containing protein [Pseudomonas sp. NDM]PWB36565.1 DUF2946 domain-containing protein [Pseudomonas sp. NDM]